MKCPKCSSNEHIESLGGCVVAGFNPDTKIESETVGCDYRCNKCETCFTIETTTKYVRKDE